MYVETVYSKNDIKKFTKDIKRLNYKGDKEKFKQVVYNGYYTRYLISSYGRLLSTDYGNKGTVKFLKYKTQKTGYLAVTIVLKNKEHKTVSPHRLVATAFIKNPKNKPEVNHKYGDKTDNYYKNLEWSTSKENIDHAYKHGLKKVLKGEEILDSVYSEKTVRKVCKMLERNSCDISTISKKTGISKEMIYRIKNHKSWKHVSCEFNIDNYNFGLSNAEVKSKEDKIKLVCEMLESNDYNIKQISEASGIGVGMVMKILKKECHIKISKHYNLSNYKSRSHNTSKNKNTTIMFND